MSSSNNKLTTSYYWEDYYKKSHANVNHIISVCSKFDDFWNQFIDDESENRDILEIGGYPGRYLAYLSSKYKLFPVCLDYNSDMEQIEACFNVMGIEDFKIIQDDFTSHKPLKKYDYVMSNGFIEHFKDYNNILDKHLEYLKPNGKLFIMIPNMTGYIKLYKYLVDYDNLKLHNLKCMKLKTFKEFALRNNLNIVRLSFFGGFPYNVHQKLNRFQKFIYRCHYILFHRFLNIFFLKYPSSYFSSSIIAIFEK